MNLPQRRFTHDKFIEYSTEGKSDMPLDSILLEFSKQDIHFHLRNNDFMTPIRKYRQNHDCVNDTYRFIENPI